jgi:hypothetical protein
VRDVGTYIGNAERPIPPKGERFVKQPLRDIDADDGCSTPCEFTRDPTLTAGQVDEPEAADIIGQAEKGRRPRVGGVVGHGGVVGLRDRVVASHALIVEPDRAQKTTRWSSQERRRGKRPGCRRFCAGRAMEVV